MPRLIVLLVAFASLAIVAIQNRATSVPLVILGKSLFDMPLGLLLLASVGLGALLTLVMYGLMGLRRPPESKYRPMGRRVPYPDSPGSSPLPASDPPSDFGSSTTGGSSYSSSSAFVSEPTSDTSKGSPDRSSTGDSDSTDAPFISPPEDRSTSSYSNSSYSDSSYSDSSYSDSSYSRSTDPAIAAPRSFVQQPANALKSVFGKGFGKKKDRRDTAEDTPKRVGDDWGELRTTEQRNTWEVGEDSTYRLEEGAKSLFNFGRNVGANAGRLAEDIASGWRQSPGQSSPDARRDVNRPADEYGETAYDGLDRGWESFDDYGEPPYEAIAGKRTYGDSLYGSDTDATNGAYSYDYADYDDDDQDDGVYDADYRVVEPPSKPLSDDDDTPDDYNRR